LHLLAYRVTDRERYLSSRAVPPQRLHVVPNGVDTLRFRPLPEEGAELRRQLGLGEAFAWLAVGRFEPAKDYPNMLAAFANVAQRQPNSILLLVGKGSLQPETEGLTRSLGLGDRVRFLGVRGDVPQLMSATDGYVLSSGWEGMPIVLLEAGAAGIPIVCTAVGGNRELVLDGVTGFVVPPGDPAALANAMMRLATLSPDQRRLFGQRGRAHIETHYSLTRIVDQWEEMYRELLAAKGRRVVLAPGNQGDATPARTSGGQR
jgi:glycosyltransferase involved in cell wall biosynthesis